MALQVGRRVGYTPQMKPVPRFVDRLGPQLGYMYASCFQNARLRAFEYDEFEQGPPPRPEPLVGSDRSSERHAAQFMWYNYCRWQTIKLVQQFDRMPSLPLARDIATWRQDSYAMRDEIALENRGIAKATAKRVHGGSSGRDRDDLIQDSMIALFRTVDEFDVRISRFSTYASFIILRELYGLTKRNALRYSDVEVGWISAEDDDSDPLVAAGVAAMARVELELLLAGTVDLPQREEYVLRRRYGYGAVGPASLAEIGNELGVTKERARQLCAQAISRLRETAQSSSPDAPNLKPARERRGGASSALRPAGSDAVARRVPA